MSERRDLLVEVGTEELPPKALRRLSEAFAEGLRQRCRDADLDFEHIRSYATPRRLAVLVSGLEAAQPERSLERRGPALTAAFDEEGQPTKAALGFARSCGVEVEQLEHMETDKGAWLCYRAVQPGAATRDLLPELITQALNALPAPKRMRWADLDETFVRPVHWLVALFGDEVVDLTVFGIKAGRRTRGHRFHRPDPMYLAAPMAYAPLLETEGHVIADMDDRLEAIRAQVVERAQAAGGAALLDRELLEEVAALVEWPVAVLGHFDERFLALPQEVLIATMQGHQKYFPVRCASGQLMPYFVAVCNIDSREPEQLRAGNERVIRPRLADAAFFWDQDRRVPLHERVPQLRAMVFQERLGSLYDKVLRVSTLAGAVAERLGGHRHVAERAGYLAKADLLTEMVGEFPELQGIMGRYYARAEGEPEALAQALEEQYRPRFAGDALPASQAGAALAIADKLDTVAAVFAIGQPPSGDKDPFGLRRAALGILRVLIEGQLDLDLTELLAWSVRELPVPGLGDAMVTEIYDFIMERLRTYYHDQGVRPDVFEAVLARRPPRPLDFDRRLRAVTEFRALAEAETLAAANKRIHNILRKAEEPIPETIDRQCLEAPAEQFLAERLAALESEVRPLFEVGDYTAALAQLARLKTAVDEFFDTVLVMAENPAVRRNRLALLARLQALFLEVADLSRLQWSG